MNKFLSAGLEMITVVNRKDCLYSTKTVYCEQLNAGIVIRERNKLNQKAIYQFTEAVQVYNIMVK